MGLSEIYVADRMSPKNENGTMIRQLLIFALLATTAACYRMPDENDYSLIPTTNNPDFTKNSGKGKGSSMPGIGY
jgi:hypothetical protein